MIREAILAAQVFDGARLQAGMAVLTEDGRIVGVIPRAEVPDSFPPRLVDDGTILASGLIDLQVNGGGGVLFNDAPDLVGLKTIAEAHRMLGTSAILPTLISAETRQIACAMDAVRRAIASGMPGILGLHVEGPFLNPDRKGIHPAASIRRPGDADLELLTAPFPAPLMVTLAPEAVPASFIRTLVEAGVTVMAGHTEATAEEIADARAAGLRGFTHLFNAMPPIAARAPGPAGAALGDPDGFASLIVDGRHVHPAVLRMAVAAKGTDRLLLVSDAMPTVGSTIERFRLGETAIALREGRLTGPDGTLGGAHLTLAEAVHNAHRLLGLTPGEALRMATATPAALLGIGDRIGRLVPGARAELALFDAELGLRGTWSDGRFAPA